MMGAAQCALQARRRCRYMRREFFVHGAGIAILERSNREKDKLSASHAGSGISPKRPGSRIVWSVQQEDRLRDGRAVRSVFLVNLGNMLR
mmetsp:Transcript_62441/g.167169  ORF Transcript_62441/g.167169 Transcript_62441/m.167169 type:complete len:90 (+) Transcript_62441:1535-1804(+)